MKKIEGVQILRYPHDFENCKFDTAFGYLVLAEYKLYEYHIKAKIKHFVENSEYTQSNYYIDDIESMSKRNDTYIYILKYGDKFCGYIIFKKDGIPGRNIYISQLYINTEARKMGFAKLLLDKVEKVTKKVKYNKIYLDVAKVNKEAIKLYESFGYLIDKHYESEVSWSHTYEKIIGEK